MTDLRETARDKLSRALKKAGIRGVLDPEDVVEVDRPEGSAEGATGAPLPAPPPPGPPGHTPNPDYVPVDPQPPAKHPRKDCPGIRRPIPVDGPAREVIETSANSRLIVTRAQVSEGGSKDHRMLAPPGSGNTAYNWTETEDLPTTGCDPRSAHNARIRRALGASW